jgi:hypothetical protein
LDKDINMSELTQRQIDVLAHVVIDPQVWWSNCKLKHPNPQSALDEKVKSWEEDYDLNKSEPGYKNRFQKEQDKLVTA